MKFISINRNYRKIGTIGNTEKKKKKNREIERVKIERVFFLFFSFSLSKSIKRYVYTFEGSKLRRNKPFRIQLTEKRVNQSQRKIRCTTVIRH